MLESRIRLLKVELDCLKRKESTGCSMGIVDRKAASTESKTDSVADGLCQDTFNLYASIRHNVDKKLLAVGSHLRNLIEQKAQMIQQSGLGAICKCVGGVQESFLMLLRLWTEP